MTHCPLVRSPQALAQLCRGFDQLAALLAITLGPTQGVVWHAQHGCRPEALTDAATLARRVVELPDRGKNAGAMILRDMVWRVRERYGDGAATATVVARALIAATAPLVVAGSNPMLIRRGIERGIIAAKQALVEQAAPIEGIAQLMHLAASVSGDSELSTLVVEMVDLLGPNAAFIVEEYAAPYLEREYVDGGRWTAVPAARGFLPEGQAELTLSNPYVLVVDEALSQVVHVRRALELAASDPTKPPILLLVRSISGAALDMLTINNHRGMLMIVAAVLTNTSTLSDDLSDIALLSGAQVQSTVLGFPPQRMEMAYFGRVRRATLRRDSITLIGGAGDASLLQARITELRQRSATLNHTDDQWQRLRLRAGRLAGGIGIMKIGAHTDRERELRKHQALQTLSVLQQASSGGVVPGGGSAYVMCQRAVNAVQNACQHSDEAEGVKAVVKALSAPLLQIVQNHGTRHPPVVLEQVQRAWDRGYGFDARTNECGDLRCAGVWDSVAVMLGALDAAASAAIMLLTTETLLLPYAK